MIARTALGIPDSLLPAPEAPDGIEAACVLAAQRDRLVGRLTADANRQRTVLAAGGVPLLRGGLRTIS